MALFTNKFYPNFISGLQLWIDASDSSTLFQDSAGTTPVTADGDPVGCWKDKSGNSNNFIQSDGTKKPTFKTSVINSKNVVSWDGVNDTIRSAGGGANGDITYIGVFQLLSGTQSWAAVVSTGKDAGGQMRNFAARSGVFSFNGNGAQVDYYSSFAWTYSTTYIGCMRLSGSNVTLYRNKSNETSGSLPLNAHSATGVVLMNSVDGNGNENPNYPFFCKGYVAEFMIYNSALSDTNINNIMTNLNLKWSAY